MRIITALLLCLGPALAQGLRQPLSHPVKATLIAEHGTAKPGTTVQAGLLLEMDPGWHVYWRNPGDAGMPPSITWTLPKGVKAAPMRWPAPHRIAMGGIITFGYSDAVLLPVAITLPEDFDGKTLVLKAKAEWLACKDVCVDGGAVLELALAVKPEAPQPDKRHRARFEAARRALPRPAPKGTMSLTRRDGLLLLKTDLPGSALTFFCQDEGVVAPGAPQKATQRGLELRLSGIRPPERLRGVLVAERQGKRTAYSIDLDVPDTKG